MRSRLLTRRQLGCGPWRRVLPDVYVHEEVELTYGDRCRAVAMILPRGSAIGGASAAFLLGAKVLRPEAPVEVAMPRDVSAYRHGGVVVRYSALDPSDVVDVDGVPVTSPVRTAFDLARRSWPDEAVAAVDALMRVTDVTVEAIRAYARDGRLRWRGIPRLDGVLDQAARGAESPMESRLRTMLVGAGLPAPSLQHSVFDGAGEHVARLDLAYVERRLGIEYDGAYHWDPEAIRRDLRRQNSLHAQGWTLLRFTADDVIRDPTHVIAQVRTAITTHPPVAEGEARRAGGR